MKREPPNGHALPRRNIVDQVTGRIDIIVIGMFRPFFIFLVICGIALSVDADGPITFVRLPAEPVIRIGLATNAGSVTITTTDSSLVAASPDEPNKILDSNRVSVSARVYHPPEIEEFRIEFQNLPAQVDAENLAKDVRDATGETALPSIDTTSNTWKVWVGRVFQVTDDAEALRETIDSMRRTPR